MEKQQLENARVDFETIGASIKTMNTALTHVISALGEITESFRGSMAASTVGDQWARTWGETVNKKEAAHMLGVGTTYLNRLIADGQIQTAPDGRVLVRAAADWANGLVKMKPKQRWQV